MRIFALLALFMIAGGIASAASEPASEPYVLGRVYSIPSKVFGGERRIVVRTPAYYDAEPDRRYTTVYVIDGGPEQDFPHIAGLAQSADVNGTFEPLIIVGVETVNRRAEITPPVKSAKLYEEELKAVPGGSADFRRFLAEDVKTFVDSHFRTSGRDAIMGESLAGLFIVETLFKSPALFDDYIAITPSMWWEEMEYGRKAGSFLKKLPAGERRLYVALSDEGFLHQQGTELLVAALEKDAPEDLKWLYVPLGQSENHASVYHGAALDAFRAFYGIPMKTGRPGRLLSGEPLAPLSEEEKARRDAPCDRETARIATPAEAALDRAPDPYECILYDFGPRAAKGTFER